MNHTGKKMRKGGLNRYELRHANHTPKSPAKRKRMNWGKSGKLPK